MITQSANYPLWNELGRKSAIFAESIQFHFKRNIYKINWFEYDLWSKAILGIIFYGEKYKTYIVFYIYIDQILYIFHFQFMWKLSRHTRGNTWSPTDNLGLAWWEKACLKTIPSEPTLPNFICIWTTKQDYYLWY